VSVITLTGANNYLLQAELHKLVASFVAEQGDMGLERLDGEEASFERLQESVTSLPFLASKKLVVLQRPGTNKKFTEAASTLLAEVPDTTDVIVVEPKLDKRLSYYKSLKKSTDYREFTELDGRGLAQWLVAQAKEQGGQLSQGDAMLLVERVGTNQQMLASELEKLLLYSTKITRESIELLTDRTPQSTIFELIEAAFAGKSKRALALYDEQRALKVEPQQIIAMLTWQLHVFALIKTAGQKTPDEIARVAKLNPFVVRKSLGVVRALSLEQLKSLVARLLDLDMRLKSQSINADDALKHYLLTLV
jgi:DNA polymerase-3 subunit delta